jgi:PIN domain nuclease of toxin-antitoxin system
VTAYVIDTHAWVWQMFCPKKLGEGALRALAAADRGEAHVYIPAVVLAEFLMIANKRRVENLTPEIVPNVIRAVQSRSAYSFEPLTPELVLISQAYTAIPDIFDRMIAAEAGQRGIPVISRDPAIHNANLVAVVWD